MMVVRGGFSTVATLLLAGGLTLLATNTEAAPTRYANQVRADGPIGYWRLGEPPLSANAADSSLSGNDGRYFGGITLGQPGFHGGDTAALFDGATGRLVVRNSETLNPAYITMEAKVSWSGPNPGPTQYQQRILEKSYDVSYHQSEAQYSLTILPDGHVQVEIRTGLCDASIDPRCTSRPPGFNLNDVFAKSKGVVAEGAETHVAATFDGNDVRIYINGAPDLNVVSAGPHAGPIEPAPLKFPHDPNRHDELGIGNQSFRDRPFYGLIDEVALFGKALTADQVLAHFQAQLEEAAGFQYAVKFVCGKSDGRVVAPGEYFTAINVHNPNERGIGFKKKFAIALPGERPGRVSKFFDAKLGPDEAFEIDCPDIFRRTDTNGEFLKGFAVIESALELDVVAVYTAAGATGRVETMELERVKPRRQGAEGKPDLIPVPDPQLGFCRRQNLKLTVTVKNQGSADAGPSLTIVDFGAAGTASQPTPALAAGASIDLLFDIPASCFHPNCPFSITVDSNSLVDESNETNNTKSGVCLG